MMAYPCEVEEQPVQKTLSIRTGAAVQDLRQVFEAGYGVIAQHLNDPRESSPVQTQIAFPLKSA